MHLSGHDGNVGRFGQGVVVPDRTDVRQHLELEPPLTESLHLHARRPL